MTVVDMVDYKLRSQVATKNLASLELPIKEEDESSQGPVSRQKDRKSLVSVSSSKSKHSINVSVMEDENINVIEEKDIQY